MIKTFCVKQSFPMIPLCLGRCKRRMLIFTRTCYKLWFALRAWRQSCRGPGTNSAVSRRNIKGLGQTQHDRFLLPILQVFYALKSILQKYTGDHKGQCNTEYNTEHKEHASTRGICVNVIVLQPQAINESQPITLHKFQWINWSMENNEWSPYAFLHLIHVSWSIETVGL